MIRTVCLLKSLLGATLMAAVLLSSCKLPGKKKAPPIKILDIDAKCEVKDHQRLLKISYRAVNLKNNCSGGSCIATLLTKIRVYGPKGGRIQLRKKDTRNRLDHKSAKELTDNLSKQTAKRTIKVDVPKPDVTKKK